MGLIAGAGWLGLVGALGCALADVLILGVPLSGTAFARRGQKVMLDVPRERLRAGYLLATAAAPLALLGIWPMFQAIQPAGPLLPVGLLASLGYALAVRTAAHATYAFVGSGLQALAAVNAQGPADTRPQLPVLRLIGEFRAFRQPLFILSGLALAVGSGWFAVAVAFFPTDLPRWAALCSPGALAGLIYFAARLLPAPLGGYLAPAFYHLGFGASFLVVLLLSGAAG